MSCANSRLECPMIIKDDESLSEGTAGTPQKKKQRTSKSGRAQTVYQKSLKSVDELSHVNEFKVKTREMFGVDGEDNGGAEKEGDVASGEVGTHHDGECDGETRASGENAMSGESGKRTLDEFVEASAKTSKNLEDITIAIELALHIITELGDSENTDESHVGEGNRGYKCCRLSESVGGQSSVLKQISRFLCFTQKGIRDLKLDFDQLSEEGFAQYCVLSRCMVAVKSQCLN